METTVCRLISAAFTASTTSCRSALTGCRLNADVFAGLVGLDGLVDRFGHKVTELRHAGILQVFGTIGCSFGGLGIGAQSGLSHDWR